MENAVWNSLLKITMQALTELGQPESSAESLIEKCLFLLANMLDLAPEVVANRLMHADNLIDFLLLMQERPSG